MEEELPDKANILNGGFVVNIKYTETNQPRFKALYVIHGTNDKEKDLLVHNSTTIRPFSARLLVASAEIFRFKLKSHDRSQAYLQYSMGLIKKTYLKLSKELESQSAHVLKLLRSLYRLIDSGDY